MVGTTTERAIFEVPAWLPADTEVSVVGTQWHQEPHQTFEREYTLEHELAEAQRRIAEMEAQLRALRGDGTGGESGDLSLS